MVHEIETPVVRSELSIIYVPLQLRPKRQLESRTLLLARQGVRLTGLAQDSSQRLRGFATTVAPSPFRCHNSMGKAHNHKKKKTTRAISLKRLNLYLNIAAGSSVEYDIRWRPVIDKCFHWFFMGEKDSVFQLNL